MENNKHTHRKELACILLLKLKEVCDKMQDLANEIAGSTEHFMDKVFQENYKEVSHKVNEYNENIQAVEEITMQITNRMNEWFDFTKDEDRIKKILFPVYYFLEKKKVKKCLKEGLDKISGKVIRNRFVKEELQLMEEQLMNQAVSKIEQQEKHQRYHQLMVHKKEILDELNYLLPTIPGMRTQFSVHDIDDLVQNL